MRVSTSKLTYVVFHMSLLQVAWGLTLVAQVCQKTFDYIIRVHIHVLLHAFATKLLQGHPIRGPKFGARLLWHRYAKKHLITSPSFTYMCFYVPLLQSSLGALFGARLLWHQKTFDYIIRVHIHVLLHAFATKLPGGHPIRGPKFGARLLWHRYAKKHSITSSSFTYMCFYLPLLQSCLGALCSGPEVRGPKFGARLFWHRYAKKHLITSSEFTYMCFYVHAFATKLPGGTPFGA